jgi:AcrR family transcriptional regulator
MMEGMQDETQDDHDAGILAASSSGAPSERPPLTQDRIVAAALAFLDEHGLANLTMRKLGERLGVEAMSLYRYVPGREELLDLVVVHLVTEMEQDVDVLDAPQDGWQDFLQRLAHGIRRVALAHPIAFPLVASRPLEAPWLRPPLRSLEWVERFLNGLLGEGFSEPNAAGAYRAFTSFLLGHLLLEVASQGADLGPLDVIEDNQRDHDLRDYPTLRRLRGPLSEDHSSIEFEEALEELLQRLALMHANSSDR